ncbi:MAG TPA: glycosyltransferase [Candidatus Binataceae bacterium]|nr:glycosyltransferase [Candidatus Binataceae bacterium]
MARISAIIPVWNAETTIAEAIESVLSQTCSDFELIVVDDGSTDRTPTILDSYRGRIRTMRRANSGPAAARNAGVAASSGAYLAFLDADDKWMPGMLAHTSEALDSDPKCAVAYCNLAMIDSRGESMGTSLIRGDFARAPSMGEILARMWPIMPSGALIRRTAFERCGGFREEFRRAGYEDAFLWLTLREQGHFHYIDEPLAQWRFSLFPDRIKAKPRGNDGQTFKRLVRERYGIDPEKLAGARIRATRSILGYAGLMALGRGDRMAARRAFGSALEIDPYRFKNRLRLLKTYLPLPLARMLSGRTARTKAWREGPIAPPS